MLPKWWLVITNDIILDLYKNKDSFWIKSSVFFGLLVQNSKSNPSSYQAETAKFPKILCGPDDGETYIYKW